MIVITMMMLIPSMAYAQDNWKPKTPAKTLNLRFGYVQLERRGYIYIIYAQTDFSLDTEIMSINLGNGREEALQSINKLIEFSELPVGNRLKFDDVELVTWGKSIKLIDEDKKIHYGDAYIGDSELKKMKKFIESGK